MSNIDKIANGYINVYFKDGGLITALIGNTEGLTEEYAELWIEGVVVDNYNWMNAVMRKQCQWTPSIISNTNNISLESTFSYFDLEIEDDLTCLDVEAAYLLDEDNNVLMYYIKEGTKGVNPSHNIRDKLVNQLCPVVKMFNEYEPKN